MNKLPKMNELTSVIESIAAGTQLLEMLLCITDNDEDKVMLKKTILLHKQLGLQLALANETIKQINNCTGTE